MAGLRERLRSATSDLHRAIESTTFFAALKDGELPKAAYVAWLRTLAAVIGVLERELERAEDAPLRAVWTSDMRKLPLLRADLGELDEVSVPENRAIEPTLTVIDTLRQWATDEPVRLLGALYVIEGSTLGGRTIRKQLAAQYGLEDHRGLAYVSSYGPRTGPMWTSFCQRLDAVELSDADREAVVDAARELFEALEEVVKWLHPLEAHEHASVERLNYEAGHHKAIHDPREVLAAIEGGERTWRLYPYYEARYGRRGRRFTRSDSAWLVTLVGEAESLQRDRIRWLSGLLATRGMPTLLLEEHLFHLHESLAEAVPERAERYADLEALGQHLKETRLNALPEFDAVSSSFPERDELPNVGPILASAVADERSGMKGVVASVEGWLTDPQRFDEDWIASIRRTLALARGPASA